MTFQDIIPTHVNRGNRSDYHARYKVLKNGVGRLLITALGIERLAALGRITTAGEGVRTFHDPAAFRLESCEGPDAVLVPGKLKPIL